MKFKKLIFKNYFALLVLLCTSFCSYAQYDSIPYDGYDRTYLVHLPTGYTGNTDLPLIIAMHGGFGNAFNMQNQSQLSVKADLENFIVVYPEGLEGGPFNISSWNAGWCCGPSSNNNIDDVGFIDSLLNTLIAEFSVDTNRIYATGMSNGGFMSYRLACELSDRIVAIAPVACSMSMTSCTPDRPIPLIHFHSTLDSNVPYLGGYGDGFSNHYNSPLDSVLNAWSNKNTCSTINDTVINNSQYIFKKWSNCDCSAEIQYYRTEDGGHSWPGGVQTATGDPASTYINATDLMWDFFQQHSLECIPLSVSDDFLTGDNISIFPNPTEGNFMVDLGSNYNSVKVSIRDLNGRLVQSKEFNNSRLLNLTIDEPAGVYLLRIESDKNTAVVRLVKE